MSRQTVTKTQQHTPTTSPLSSGILQRQCNSCGQKTFADGKCAECQKNKSLLQRRASSQPEVEEVPPIVHEVLRSPGQPLDADTRVFMESRFEHDFSQVRVHTDAQAAKSAKAVNALAYTVGHDIVFDKRQYTPETLAGQRLIAHELTHTIQQHHVDASIQRKLDIASPNDPLETEADQVAKVAIGDMQKPRITQAVPLLAPFTARLQRQTIPPGGGVTAPPRRIVYIDANVIDQINRGNTAAATSLRQMLTSGADVRIPQQVYQELVIQPSIPRTATANRLILEELGIQQGLVSSQFTGVRSDTIDRNFRPEGQTIVSPQDAQVITAARVGGGEVWSFDRAFRMNPQNIQATFNVRVAPESNIALAPEGSVRDYRVGRQLLGLPPVEISLSGIVTRGSIPPSGGGSSGSSSPPPGGGRSTPPGTTATRPDGTTATVGTRDMQPIQVGAPSPRGVAIVGGIQLAFQGANLILNWINDEIQASHVRQALATIESEIASIRTTNITTGVLLVLFYTQMEAPSESLIRPGAVFSHIETANGHTRDEAEERWQKTPAIRQGAGSNTTIRTQQVWIPPVQPPGIAAIRTPFPPVTIGTFAAGRARLQDVEWGGLTGFDDEGESNLTLPPHMIPEFFILRLPARLNWFYQGLHTSDIPVEDRQAERGSIPVVNLDPIIPFSNVAAACVFPANDATDALFSTTRTTQDNFRHLRYPNFAKARWVRPENIRLLPRP